MKRFLALVPFALILLGCSGSSDNTTVRQDAPSSAPTVAQNQENAKPPAASPESATPAEATPAPDEQAKGKEAPPAAGKTMTVHKASNAPGGVLLRLNLKEGAGYTFVSTQNMEQEMEGKSTPSKQETTMTVKVKKKQAADYLIETTIDEVSLTDGNTAQSGPTPDSSLAGLRYETTYDAQGRQKKGASKTTDARLQQLTSIMASLEMGFLGLEFPEQAVNVGDSWTIQYDFDAITRSLPPGSKIEGSKNFPMTYKVLKFENEGGKRLAVLGVSMNGDLKMVFSMGDPKQKPLTMTLNTKMDGTMRVDTETGLPVNSSIKGVNDIQSDILKLKQKMEIETRLKK